MMTWFGQGWRFKEASAILLDVLFLPYFLYERVDFWHQRYLMTKPVKLEMALLPEPCVMFLAFA